MATQSHRSNGPRGALRRRDRRNPVQAQTASFPVKVALVSGTRAWMISSDTNNTRPRGSWIRILLFLFGLLLLTLLTSAPAHAQSVGGCVANFGGVIDGFVNPVPPSQINIDGNCTIRNFPASNPLTSNSSFTGTGRGWLVVFDNVDFIGNLACDKSHENFIWFVNGSITTVRPNCQNFFIPVEKIDKENPAGQTTAAIGVP